jgi:hypothetical protein
MERITIFETDQCPICRQHRRYTTGYRYDDEHGNLLEVRINTEHPECRRLVNKIEKTRDELQFLDMELFRKRWNIQN